jgi:hypothetical protein
MVCKVVREVKTKIAASQGRHTIYLKSTFINDSNFPFKVGERLKIRIENDKLIVERDNK